MANMSEEWRDSIVEEVLEEGYVDWKKGELASRTSGRHFRKVDGKMVEYKPTQSPYDKASRSQFRKMADAQTTRGTQGKIGKKGKLARLAAKQQDVIQKTTQKYNQDNG